MKAWINSLALTLALNGAAFAATVESPKPEPAKAEKAAAAKSEMAKADENRKKPLQRCDELKDKGQVECLKKARERIVEARAKRESAGEKK